VQPAIKLCATVLAGHRIEITALEWSEGAHVEVIVMLPEALEHTLSAVPPPLSLVEGDTVRIGNTRIPLERVIYAFNHGCAPE
jgi:hypothetical protein